MEHRLRRHEKDALRRQYKDNAIYKAFAAPCKRYEAQAAGFRLSPEELFWECVAALDNIKEAPEEAHFDLQAFWSDKAADYTELGSGIGREHIEQAANLVTLAVVLCLGALDLSLYNTLSLMLAGQLEWDSPTMVEMREHLTANVYRLGEDAFSAAVAAYMDSDDFVSDDIEDLLDELPQVQVVVADDDGQEADMPRLTNQQLALLMDFFINAGFKNTPHTPVTVEAYAKLLSMISGRSAESIRKKMGTIDYDAPRVKADINKLADLLEPINPKIAKRFRSQSD